MKHAREGGRYAGSQSRGRKSLGADFAADSGRGRDLRVGRRSIPVAHTQEVAGSPNKVKFSRNRFAPAGGAIFYCGQRPTSFDVYDFVLVYMDEPQLKGR